MRWSLLCIVVIISGICAEDGGVNNSTEMMFPMCGPCNCTGETLSCVETFYLLVLGRSEQHLHYGTVQCYEFAREFACPSRREERNLLGE